MSDLTAAQAKYEIDHPAFPRKELAETDGYSPKYSQVEAGELAFVSLVRWLEMQCQEHTQLDETTGLEFKASERRLCSECLESLLKAVKEWRENDHP